MNNTSFKEALSAFVNKIPGVFSTTENRYTVTPISGGLINNSFLVQFDNSSPILLQKINDNVFSNPGYVQHNFITISEYIANEFPELRLPQPVYTNNHAGIYIDKQRNYWRAFEFIQDAYCPEVAEDPAQVRSMAKTFAAFTAAFQNFDPGKLKIVIHDFHNLSFRYEQFRTALENSDEIYKELAAELINKLTARESYVDFYKNVSGSPSDFPLRVMHLDAKIANVLFSKKTGDVVCLIDFDTVMPGYFFSDIGDMVRSTISSRDENSVDFDAISVREDFYKAIIDGYMEVMGPIFTTEEKRSIHYSGLIMIYMQAMRFLTDYLNKNLYYQVSYTEQNFDRAKNQVVLLERLEEFLKNNFQFKDQSVHSHRL